MTGNRAERSGKVRAAVYLGGAADRALAEKVLGSAKPEDGAEFSGVIEGDLEPAQVKKLDEAGLVVSVVDHPAGPQHREWSPEDTEAIEALRDRSRTVGFSDDGEALVVGKNPADDPDPQLHRLAGLTPKVEEALPEDAYNIELRGPLTRHQRQRLEELRVEIASYEPDFGYRTILTREQYAAVRKLPFVAGVSRYRFSQTVTPELLQLATRDETGKGAELLSDSEEAASEPQLFDCLLHREADLEKVAALIENTAGTEVVGHTNLKVRFRATADLPLIAALASLPAVRKISPYEAPTL